eukprot:SAG31_NODE_1040_length_10203_cov_3.045428_8_plen_65_part_00
MSHLYLPVDTRHHAANPRAGRVHPAVIAAGAWPEPIARLQCSCYSRRRRVLKLANSVSDPTTVH